MTAWARVIPSVPGRPTRARRPASPRVPPRLRRCRPARRPPSSRPRPGWRRRRGRRPVPRRRRSADGPYAVTTRTALPRPARRAGSASATGRAEHEPVDPEPVIARSGPPGAERPGEPGPDGFDHRGVNGVRRPVDEDAGQHRRLGQLEGRQDGPGHRGPDTAARRHSSTPPSMVRWTAAASNGSTTSSASTSQDLECTVARRAGGAPLRRVSRSPGSGGPPAGSGARPRWPG